MKQFTPTAGQISAAKAVFIAMAGIETIKPIVQDYQKGILRDLGWGHIGPKQSYQLPDDVFAVYNQRCHAARDAAGLVVEDPDFCPLLVVEHLLCQAQRCLIDSMEPVTKINADKILCLGLESYQQYVELTLRLLAPYCKGVKL